MCRGPYSPLVPPVKVLTPLSPVANPLSAGLVTRTFSASVSRSVKLLLYSSHFHMQFLFHFSFDVVATGQPNLVQISPTFFRTFTNIVNLDHVLLA